MKQIKQNSIATKELHRKSKAGALWQTDYQSMYLSSN
jgi:hypothetical protein